MKLFVIDNKISHNFLNFILFHKILFEHKEMVEDPIRTQGSGRCLSDWLACYTTILIY